MEIGNDILLEQYPVEGGTSIQVNYTIHSIIKGVGLNSKYLNCSFDCHHPVVMVRYNSIIFKNNANNVFPILQQNSADGITISNFLCDFLHFCR